MENTFQTESQSSKVSVKIPGPHEEVPDELWESLYDPERIKASQKAAEQAVIEFTTEEYNHLRRKAKTDLFFLSYGILGYDSLTAGLHRHLCSWLMNTAGEQYRIVLMPRGHFKTTIVTISDTIQIVLTDDNGDCPYPRNLGPEGRVMLAHETHAGASRFLYEITGQFTANPTLMGLFPECVPHPRRNRMNKEMLELPRQSTWAEPTIDTMGVGAKSQGRHYNRIKLDDIFGDKARDSKTEGEATLQWFDNIQAFLIKLARDGIDMAGTRYSLDDVWAHAMKVYEGQLLRYIRRIEEISPESDVPLPIFPEHFPVNALKILRKNKKVWAAQYVNDPIAGLAVFDPSWKRYFQWVGPRRVAIFTGVERFVFNTSDLDIVILADPAVDHEPGIVVTGTSPKLQVFVLESIQEEMSPTKFVATLFQLVQKWWPRKVGIEKFTFGRIYESWLKREMQVRGVSFNIEQLTRPPEKSKTEHIMGLENYFSALQIFFDQKWEGSDEEENNIALQFDQFGATDAVHMLDALAYGPQLWVAPLSREKQEEFRRAEEEVMARIDPTTGYSRM